MYLIYYVCSMYIPLWKKGEMKMKKIAAFTVERSHISLSLGVGGSLSAPYIGKWKVISKGGGWVPKRLIS